MAQIVTVATCGYWVASSLSSPLKGAAQCTDGAGVYIAPTFSSGVLMSQEEYNVVAGPFDYTLAGAFWAWGFTAVLVLYFSAHVIGLVLKQVRNG